MSSVLTASARCWSFSYSDASLSGKKNSFMTANIINNLIMIMTHRLRPTVMFLKPSA